ncbi:DUF4082 domain-containing protein [Actinokineospora auranticolor]|uniref:Uncharacterized protein DUF4082 n=1 Tax=Actinokineospora auranticolor TaxID=155976 RepID=A0A2S6GWG2_9PSEU|nr:DUF4082 domain-containing protein [Actinokineospora auranticolor]PPK69520.1 uncharacterized protein DUF4082 [Actinokineospora auranticolor]
MPRKLAAVLLGLLLFPVVAASARSTPDTGKPDPSVTTGVVRSTIALPLADDVLPVGVPVLFAGEASYDGPVAKRVTAVDISFDAGRTWLRAQGTGPWSIEHAFTAPGARSVISRATAEDEVEVWQTALPLHAGTGPLPKLACERCEFWQPNRGDTRYLRIDDDPRPVELGIRFAVDRPGHITGVLGYNFYDQGRGERVGRLWSADGKLLAEAGPATWFSNEFTFDTPVPVRPGQTYVASYYTPYGRYPVTARHFTATTVRAPFITRPNAGVYRYADEGPVPESGGFPDKSFEASYYWTIPIFAPTR